MSDIDSLDSVALPQEESPKTSLPSLGEQLRAAREARGMSIDEVVHSLKFSARQIEAVEAGHMDVLPGAVFQRGLVRSYARLLKLDPEPLLMLVDAGVPVQEPDIRAPENMGNAAPRSGLRQIPPLVAISILLLIVAATMIGWHFLSGGLSGLMPISTRLLSDIQLSKNEERKAVESGSPAAVSALAPPVAEPPVPVASSAEPVVVPAQTEPKAQPVAVAESAVAPEPLVNARHVSFNFSGESWIEVKDANGVVILTGIYTSGTRSVTGSAPLEVVIGNAAMVTLMDNGKVVDLKPYTRSEVSRLTLQ